MTTDRCKVQGGNLSTEVAEIDVCLKTASAFDEVVRHHPVVLNPNLGTIFNISMFYYTVAAVKRRRFSEEWRNWQTRRIQNAVTERP